MARNESFKERIKQSLIFIFAFIPFMQWLTCFMAFGRTKKKKWIIYGMVNIVIFIMAYFLNVYSDAYYRDHMRGVKSPSSPSVSDYVSEEIYDQGYSVYSKTPEYKAYDKAMDEYYNSKEYLEYDDISTRVHSTSDGIEYAAQWIAILNYFIFMILLFWIERYRFIDDMAYENDRRAIFDELSGGRSSSIRDELSSVQKRVNENENILSSGRNTTADIIKDNVEKTDTDNGKSAAGNNTSENINNRINVNSATEEMLASLPGIGVVDAKKIIAYRNANGNFGNIDDFFASFNAKPHIVVRLENRIDVEMPKPQSQYDKADVKGKSGKRDEDAQGVKNRRFDL